MSGTQVFGQIYIGGIIAGVLHTVSFFVYTSAGFAFIFKDEVNDPWQTFDHWKFIISAGFIFPLAVAFLTWVNYRKIYFFTFHFVIQTIFIVWGAVHIIIFIIEVANCNGMDPGPVPKFPWCINRFFPAKDIPDLRFFLLFVSVIVLTFTCVYWVFFGIVLRRSSLLIIKLQKKQRQALSSQGRRTYREPFNTYLASQIGAALHDFEKNKLNNPNLPYCDYHEKEGQRVIDALAEYQHSKGRQGLGIPSQEAFYGMKIGDGFNQMMRSYREAITHALGHKVTAEDIADLKAQNDSIQNVKVDDWHVAPHPYDVAKNA